MEKLKIFFMIKSVEICNPVLNRILFSSYRVRSCERKMVNEGNKSKNHAKSSHIPFEWLKRE